MRESIFPLGVMGVTALLVAIATSKVIGKLSPERSTTGASKVVSVAVLSAMMLLFLTKDRMGWAHWITSPSAIIYSNGTVLALAVAAGGIYHLPNRPRWRRVGGSVVLGLLAMAALFQPALQPIFRPAVGGNSWASGGVCLQSTPHNCSAAAGATLLKARGIDVTEKQMVDWCWTDARGTPSLGLWRGLSLASKGTEYHPVAISATADQLIQRGPWPSILVVGLPLYGADPVYHHKYGWAPGFRHSVVLFGIKPDGMVDIGDPSIGRETWSQKDLQVLYRGEAVTLDEIPPR